MVNYDKDKFLGLLHPSAFANRGNPSQRLVDGINAGEDINTIRALLEEVRPGTTTFVTEITTPAKSLGDRLWKQLETVDQPVAVLTDDDQSRGVTARTQLIEAVTGQGR